VNEMLQQQRLNPGLLMFRPCLRSLPAAPERRARRKRPRTYKSQGHGHWDTPSCPVGDV